MGKIRVAGTAELISMALGSNFVRPADHPRIFGRAVFTELCEEFFKAGFELTGDAVTLKAQWHITGRRHVLVYALKGAAREPWRAGLAGLPQNVKGRLARRPFVRKSIYYCRFGRADQESCCC